MLFFVRDSGYIIFMIIKIRFLNFLHEEEEIHYSKASKIINIYQDFISTEFNPYKP
jgi:hypothetical protein